MDWGGALSSGEIKGTPHLVPCVNTPPWRADTWRDGSGSVTSTPTEHQAALSGTHSAGAGHTGEPVFAMTTVRAQKATVITGLATDTGPLRNARASWQLLFFNGFYLLEQFLVHSKTERKVQTVLTSARPPDMHTPHTISVPAGVEPLLELMSQHGQSPEVRSFHAGCHVAPSAGLGRLTKTWTHPLVLR